MFNVAIIYRTPEGRPLSLAVIESRRLLREAAEIGLAETDAKAKQLYDADPVLGRIQMEEAEKLKRILSAFVCPDEDEGLPVN